MPRVILGSVRADRRNTLRYVATGFAAFLLLVAALLWRREATLPAPQPVRAVVEQPDEVTVQESPDGGRSVSVRHRFNGRLSRASLVYELNGTEQTADEASGCQRELQGGGKIREEAEATVVELSGQVPEGACRVNLLIQDELGTHALPIPLQ